MMKDRKAQMALEYIAKLMIIVVVIAVVIGMMFHFKKDIVKKWETISDPDGDKEPDPNAAFIDLGATPLTASDFANFIETCWAETRDAEDSKVCFVLKGTTEAGLTEATITPLLDPKITVDFTGVNFGDDLFSINYVIVGNEIHIKS